jgi:hypothetical protein
MGAELFPYDIITTAALREAVRCSIVLSYIIDIDPVHKSGSDKLCWMTGEFTLPMNSSYASFTTSHSKAASYCTQCYQKHL